MITPLVRERLIENACSGTSHAQIAEKYGVNQLSITRCFAVAFDQIKEMWEEL